MQLCTCSLNCTRGGARYKGGPCRAPQCTSTKFWLGPPAAAAVASHVTASPPAGWQRAALVFTRLCCWRQLRLLRRTGCRWRRWLGLLCGGRLQRLCPRLGAAAARCPIASRGRSARRRAARARRALAAALARATARARRGELLERARGVGHQLLQRGLHAVGERERGQVLLEWVGGGWGGGRKGCGLGWGWPISRHGGTPPPGTTQRPRARRRSRRGSRTCHSASTWPTSARHSCQPSRLGGGRAPAPSSRRTTAAWPFSAANCSGDLWCPGPPPGSAPAASSSATQRAQPRAAAPHTHADSTSRRRRSSGASGCGSGSSGGGAPSPAAGLAAAAAAAARCARRRAVSASTASARLSRAAYSSGLSPRRLSASGSAPASSRAAHAPAWPARAATCSGSRPARCQGGGGSGGGWGPAARLRAHASAAWHAPSGARGRHARRRLPHASSGASARAPASRAAAMPVTSPAAQAARRASICRVWDSSDSQIFSSEPWTPATAHGHFNCTADNNMKSLSTRHAARPTPRAGPRPARAPRAPRAAVAPPTGSTAQDDATWSQWADAVSGAAAAGAAGAASARACARHGAARACTAAPLPSPAWWRAP